LPAVVAVRCPLDQPGLAEHPQVVRDAAGGQLEGGGQLAGGRGAGHGQPIDDPPPVRMAECCQGPRVVDLPHVAG
jgi:hypothetical protein